YAAFVEISKKTCILAHQNVFYFLYTITITATHLLPKNRSRTLPAAAYRRPTPGHPERRSHEALVMRPAHRGASQILPGGLAGDGRSVRTDHLQSAPLYAVGPGKPAS